MTKPNKDRELLRECLQAFRAIPQANTSRNLLKLWGVRSSSPYAGTGSLILAEHMVAKLSAHLGDGFDETRQQLDELGKASGGSHRQHIGD